MSCIVHLNGGVPAYSVMPKVVTVTFFVCVLPRIMCDTLRTSDIPQIYTVGKGVIYPILCSIHQIYVYQAYWYYWPVLTVRTMRLYLSEILQYKNIYQGFGQFIFSFLVSIYCYFLLTIHLSLVKYIL